jgi:hypothetical protein
MGCGPYCVLLDSRPGSAHFCRIGSQDGVPGSHEPPLSRAHTAWRQGVQVAGPDAAMLDQSGPLQHVQVLAHRRPADRQPLRQLSYRRRPIVQEFEDAPADWLAESVEDGFN